MLIFIHALGGLGLFLLGMLIMTDALRALAGAKIRSALMKFTRSPSSGVIAGATATAILQSSSATTVAAVGFVGAGLMTFSASLGIIFGANIGTTITGWLVALIGFKLKLSLFMQPMIFVGVALRVFGSALIGQLGMAIAGFGLIFVGISTMQDGMSGLQAAAMPDVFPADTLAGRLKLVGIGVVITLITQSSSAGVAAALTAVFAGAIDFGQAASLVIGMDVGTTVTTAIATIGGTVGARRTGFSHVIYNVMTGIGALFILTPYIFLWDYFAPEKLTANPEIALVGFHSTFNILGVLIILPFTKAFGRLMQQAIPDQADAYSKSLDKKLLSEPDLALIAVQTSIHAELRALLNHLISMLSTPTTDKVDLRAMQTALEETKAYVDLLHLEKNKLPAWDILIAQIHTLDHMQRLFERCEVDKHRAGVACQTTEMSQHIKAFKSALNEIVGHLDMAAWPEAHRCADESFKLISGDANNLRRKITSKIAEGSISVPAGVDSLEAVRWLRRISIHVLRITHYQSKAQEYLAKA